MLAHGIIMVEQGLVNDAIRMMTFLTKLPNRQFQAWAHFFLGMLYQTQGTLRMREASAQGKAINGLLSSTHLPHNHKSILLN